MRSCQKLKHAAYQPWAFVHDLITCWSIFQLSVLTVGMIRDKLMSSSSKGSGHALLWGLVQKLWWQLWYHSTQQRHVFVMSYPLLEETQGCFEKEKVFTWWCEINGGIHCNKLASCINRCLLKVWTDIWCNIVPLFTPKPKGAKDCEL